MTTGPIASLMQAVFQSNYAPDVVYGLENSSNFSWNSDEPCEIGDVPNSDRCDYVQAVVDCYTTSRLDYLSLSYCSMSKLVILSYIVLIFWLAFLFINLVLVVDTRVVPNINTCAKTLGLSDTLAGVTLLAMGNGAADVFSAAAAVSATEEGGQLAVAGLMGGGLFVVLVVAGLLAYNFGPYVTIKQIGRDAGMYLFGVAWIAMVLSEQELKLWESLGFFVIYILYVVYIVVAERMANAAKARGEDEDSVDDIKDTESSALLNKGGSGPSQDIVNKMPGYTTHDGSWYDTVTRMDLLQTEHEAWSDKSRLIKAVTIIQIPLKFVLYITAPIVHNDDRAATWDRNLHVILALTCLPTITLIFDESAFYWDGQISVPSLIISSAIGVVLAILVRCTSHVDEPPSYQAVFAALGFFIALSFIYIISDEVVSVLRSFGIMWQIDSSLLGMTVLGIGNGTCDLIANYLMAKQGFPDIAMAAVYGGPVFNLFVGLGVSGVMGYFKYGQSYAVESDKQLYIGVVFLSIALVFGIGFSASGQFTRRHGIVLFALYGIFLLTSLISYIFV
eukprot:m.144513 g.144513  ORF g.144513 m.144513 type:complete len:561 (-) comp17713_c0_seq3:135-1817(-)